MATPPPLRVVEHLLVAYRHLWRGSAVVSFAGPALFLAAIGVGLGSIVDRSPGEVPYLDWVAPGLLASAAMQTAAAESTFPVMAGMKWLRTYHAMVTTPLTVGDVVAGQLTYVALRLLTTAAAFALVMTAFGVRVGLGVVAAVPAAVLCGGAFAAPILAWSATRTMDASFPPLFRFVIAPLFLFSGAFFPVRQLPGPLPALATLTPAWHGVALSRDLVLGAGRPLADAGHVLYLAAWAAAGWAFARRTFAARLAR